MARSLLSVAVLVLAAGVVHAQTVEFRLVERNGQLSIPLPVGTTPTTDAVINFAVQARVVGGGPTVGVGAFQFSVATGPCELDSFGTLTRLLISNVDGSYAPNPFGTANNTVGRGGIAAQYTYLAATNPDYNGLINTSGGTFTNGPTQEIFQIAGSCAGNALLLQTDLNHDGNPDTWSGAGTTAPIEQTYAEQYLGAGGNWVDVYRFKYTVTTVNAGRYLSPSLVGLSAQVMTGLQLVGGVWQGVQATAPASSANFVQIAIAYGGGPGTTGVCCNPSTGSCVIATSCTCADIDFRYDASCSPNPCDQPGACCVSSGACSFTTDYYCFFIVGGHWTAGGAGVACTPNPCPQLGTCCSPASGQCTFVFQSACTGVWTTGGACSPNPCPQTGACCQSASCSLVGISACPTPGQFHGIGSTCGTLTNLTTCCPANFNAINGLTTQDIFDFLGAWFASDPRADFDHDSVLAVFDIFAFLHDWFLGCS